VGLADGRGGAQAAGAGATLIPSRRVIGPVPIGVAATAFVAAATVVVFAGPLYAQPTFGQGWLGIWACVVALLFAVRVLEDVPAPVARIALHLPPVLALVMLGQFACGIGWDASREYSIHLAHKLTAAALLQGKLFYPYGVGFGLDPDYEVYNGAVFTNWNYGVPLLQLPFHALTDLVSLDRARLHFFPDRLIFLFYYALSAGLAYAAVRRYLETVTGWANVARSLAATAFVATVFSTTLFWLVSYRFLVYEETMAYFVLFQVDALASLILYRVTRRPPYLVVLGITQGIALLVRPTALVYVIVYAIVVWAGRRSRGELLRYAVACAPFVIIFIALNLYRTGSPVSLGIGNTNPGSGLDYQKVRFGVTCLHGTANAAEVAVVTAANLFWGPQANTPALDRCNLVMESSPAAGPPYVGWGFSLLLLLGLVELIRARALRADVLAPPAAILLLFGAYVYGAMGFAYRYADDLLPLYVLFFALVVLRRWPQPRGRWIALCGVAGAVLVGVQLATQVAPQLRTVLKAETPAVAMRHVGLWGATPLVYWNRYDAAALPTVRSCGDRPLTLPGDKLGWNAACIVGPFVNLFMALPQDQPAPTRFTLQVEVTGGPPPDRAYVNGRTYRMTDGRVDFSADLERMVTPDVLVSLLWSTPPPVAPHLRQVSIVGARS
jgi:hypothetical protein